MEGMAAEWRQTRPTRAKFSDNESDLRLLARIAQGDRDALRELYATYYYPVLRFIQRVTRQLDLAQEGVNDVMLVVWRSADSFGHRSSVSTCARWTASVATTSPPHLSRASRSTWPWSASGQR